MKKKKKPRISDLKNLWPIRVAESSLIFGIWVRKFWNLYPEWIDVSWARKLWYPQAYILLYPTVRNFEFWDRRSKSCTRRPRCTENDFNRMTWQVLQHQHNLCTLTWTILSGREDIWRNVWMTKIGENEGSGLQNISLLYGTHLIRCLTWAS